MFAEYKKLDLSKLCSEVNVFWEKNKIFEKSISSRSEKNRFVFYEGPPSANGLPGIHHVMARLIKDIFCRYKTLSGFRVDRKAGWDTHGLPVELSVEKDLNIKKDDIGNSISISEYNEACKKTVMKYTEVWNELTEIMGYWVDVDSPYITYKNKYMETVWFLLKRLFDKNLIYKGYTIQPYSPAAGTGLSSHELNQPGCYKLVKDLSVFALFEVRDVSVLFEANKKVFFAAWTTTPWTLFANTGLAVGKKITYVFVETLNPFTLEEIILVCAEDCLSRIFDEKTKKTILKQNPSKSIYTVVFRCKGVDLIDLRYHQLLPYLKPQELVNQAFRVVSADFVNTTDGSGVVHLAPTFGADDFMVAKKEGIPPMLILDKKNNLVPIVDLSGRFVDGLGEFSGRCVKSDFGDDEGSVDIDIVVKLKKSGLAFKSEKYEHSYPHCWRTDKPILYYPLDSWFIKSTDYRDLMMRENDKINWKPKSTGEGRFQNWLENINDWNLSRSRFWGIPLPIWRSKDGGEVICVGSVKELKVLCEESVSAGNMLNNPLVDFIPDDMSSVNYDRFDLHKNWVDKIVLTSKSGKPMYRESDVIDVWFDSGSMPYAQWHYPFENKDLIDSGSFFPADFIAEGVDQTRGWFFTLHAIGVMCFGRAAFKNVISNGLVLDSVGQKMSKRLGNTVNPFDVIKEHGADSLRWYMITNSQPWDNLKFDISGVVEVKQKLFSTLHNIYSFFSLYANIDRFKYVEPVLFVKDRPLLDQWILSELNTLIKVVERGYVNYEPTLVGRAIQEFVVDKLSNWYVRLCRRRFWKGDYDVNKVSAYQTLYDCLVTVSKLASPIAPFFMERLFLDLNQVSKKDLVDSVHLSTFPVVDGGVINEGLEFNMALTRDICSLALSIRKKENIRVRQPLESIVVCLNDSTLEQGVVVDLIKSEINVKSVLFSAESDGLVKKCLVPNFSVLGKKYGSLMREIVSGVKLFTDVDVLTFIKNGEISLFVNERELILFGDDLVVKVEDLPGFLTAKNNRVLVSLNTSISKSLLDEGFAREFVNFMQGLRKDLNLVVTDTVSIVLFGDVGAVDIILNHRSYVEGEVLAKSIVVSDKKPKNNTLFEFNNYKMYIAIEE